MIDSGQMHAENDNSDELASGRFQPSRLALYLPAAVIFAGYGVLLTVLVVLGKADGAIARLCLVVLTLAIPFLVAHASLRLVTARLVALPHTLHLHPGFPRNDRFEIPYALIASMRVRHGIAGRLLGSATLVLELADGQVLAACDLADAEGAMTAIAARRHALASQPPASEELAPLAKPLVIAL